MRFARIGTFLFAAACCMTVACYSPSVKKPGPEDPFKGTTIDPNAGPINEAPPPDNLKEPDMDFIKDMLRRSADQGAQCNNDANAGPRGIARVEVTFTRNGRVSEITVRAPHEGTPIGDCIKRAFDGIFVTGWRDAGSVTLEREIDFSKKAQDPTP